MNAPRIPSYTCPLIDEVIDIIEAAFNIADKAEDSDEPEDWKQALHDIRYRLSGEAKKLEPIRAANLALRNAAEYWREEAEKLAEI